MTVYAGNRVDLRTRNDRPVTFHLGQVAPDFGTVLARALGVTSVGPPPNFNDDSWVCRFIFETLAG